MSVEELNTKLHKFFEEYTSSAGDIPAALAQECSKGIKSYYAQNAIERYNSLSTGSFNERLEIQTMDLYHEDVALHAQVERFKEILGAQGKVFIKLKQELINTNSDLEKKNSELEDMKKKLVQKNVAKNKISVNHSGTIDSQIFMLENKTESLSTEIKTLEEKKVRLDKNRLLVEEMNKLTAEQITTNPINHEELHLIHSIKGVFDFKDDEFKRFMKSEELIKAMKDKLASIKPDPEDLGRLERQKAMQELSDYYSDFNKVTSETEPLLLNLPNNLKIKSITFDSPQQYSLTDKVNQISFSIETSETSGKVRFEMPEGLRLASPKKAMMHITFENGAELSVTPGPKPKLFLPNRNNFASGELGNNAYDASIKIFAEQYLAMRHGHLGDKIILEFNGLASEDKIDLREKFIDALLFQKAERKEGNKVVIDQKQVDIVRRATNGLFDDKTEAGVCEKFWQDYANKNTRSWSEYLSGSKPVDMSRFKSHSDVKMKLILAKAVSLFQEKIAAPDNPNTYCHAIGEILRKPIDGIKYVFEAKEVIEAKKLAQAIECLAQGKSENNDESEKLVKKYLQAQHNGTMEDGKGNDIEGIFRQFKAECQQSYNIAKTTKFNFSRGP